MLVGTEHWQYDDSVWRTPGVIYDLGCLRWDWCKPFMGERVVVGVDPQEQEIPLEAILVRAMVGTYNGTCGTAGDGNWNTGYCSDPEHSTPIVTCASLFEDYGAPALVKMNIEGGEIPIIFTAKQPMAPQLVIAFHGWMHKQHPEMPPPESTAAALDYLAKWYNITMTCEKYQWYCMTVKE